MSQAPLRQERTTLPTSTQEALGVRQLRDHPAYSTHGALGVVLASNGLGLSPAAQPTMPPPPTHGALGVGPRCSKHSTILALIPRVTASALCSLGH
ncbi:hypothetical protein V6N13_119929 [Hibiscus sabdariffa]